MKRLTDYGTTSVRGDRAPWAIEQRNVADDAAIDRQLVARVSAGDHAALSVLYDRHGGMVYSIALSILRNPGSAEDVA